MLTSLLRSPGTSEWAGVCAECSSSQGGIVVLFLIICEVFTLVLHQTSQSSSGSVKSALDRSLRLFQLTLLHAVLLFFTQTSLFMVGDPLQTAIRWCKLLALSCCA